MDIEKTLTELIDLHHFYGTLVKYAVTDSDGPFTAKSILN